MLFSYIIIFFSLSILVLIPIGLMVLKLLRSKNLSFWTTVLLSLNLGSIFFAVFTFIAWYFKLYILSYLLYLPTSGFLFFLIIKNAKRLRKLGIFQIDIVPLVSIVFVSLICLAITFNSGTEINGGIKFYGANGHDGLSFLALEQELQRNIPPQNPTYSGVPLSNYHYLVYILISGIEFVTKIPFPILNFKIIPFFFILLYSSSIYFLVLKITNSKLAGIMGVLLSSIASNLYYIVPLLSPAAVTSPSVFWVNEYLTRMVNPQLLFSYIVLLTILLLIINLKKNSKLFITVVGFLTGTLIIVKAFAGVLFIGALFVLSLLSLKKKDFTYIKILGVGLIFSVFFYLLSGNKISSIMIFSPFWFIKNMYESPDHLNLSDWELRRQHYLSKGNFLRVFQLYVQGLIVFLLGNLGGRILGLFAYSKNDEELVKDVKVLLISLGVLSTAIPLFFLVKGIAWNSIQFFYYSVFSFSILTVLFLSRIYKREKMLGLIIFSVVSISLLPGVYSMTVSYLSIQNGAIFPANIYQAAKFLKSQNQGAVLLDPAFTGDSFISAVSGHTSYFADEAWLAVQLVPFAKRRDEAERFFSSKSLDLNFLEKNNIRFIFTFSKQQKFSQTTSLVKIYQNTEIAIYEFKK